MFATYAIVSADQKSLATGEPSINIQRRLTDPVLAAQIRYRHAILALLQNRQDLRVRKSRFLHRLLLAYPRPEKSIFQPNDFPGGLSFPPRKCADVACFGFLAFSR